MWVTLASKQHKKLPKLDAKQGDKEKIREAYKHTMSEFFL